MPNQNHPLHFNSKLASHVLFSAQHPLQVTHSFSRNTLRENHIAMFPLSLFLYSKLAHTSFMTFKQRFPFSKFNTSPFFGRKMATYSIKVLLRLSSAAFRRLYIHYADACYIFLFRFPSRDIVSGHCKIDIRVCRRTHARLKWKHQIKKE